MMKGTTLSLVVFVILITVASFGVADERGPLDPPEGYYFVGCRPSFGECRMSCVTRKFWAIFSPDLCNDFTSPDDKIACFCAPPEANSLLGFSDVELGR
ncbi:MAG: hypothetical protein ACKOA8_08405 [Deltaproteobacteria bacterium]